MLFPAYTDGISLWNKDETGLEISRRTVAGTAASPRPSYARYQADQLLESDMAAPYNSTSSIPQGRLCEKEANKPVDDEHPRANPPRNRTTLN